MAGDDFEGITMRSGTTIAGLLLATALLLAPPTHASTGTSTSPAPAAGELPPQLLGKDRNGNQVDLGAHRGKVVIVTFWASWCGYCLKELPVLDRLQVRAGDRILRIIAVNVEDDNDVYRAMTRQMRDYTLTMTRDRNGRIARGYGVDAYPNLWLIDPQGRIAGHYVGYGEDTLAEILTTIKTLLEAEVERQQAAPAPAAAAEPVATG